MKLVLLADEERKKEFLSVPVPETCEITWFDGLPDTRLTGVDLLVDLHNQFSPERIRWIQQQAIPCVMVSYPTASGELPGEFIRINGWPGFIGRTVIEGSATDMRVRSLAEQSAASLNRNMEWIKGTTIFTSQRIIAAMINEAFLLVSESVASEEDIDTAMKLGTNYPYGPFEWAYKIGYANLLIALEYDIKEKGQRNVSILLKEKALAQ
ncbi:MAG: hypothetical protein EOO09_10400 [Chitinophagaceae bacterium]|nr:MAG: hypothetical protein EOO09_10400 [Chitinophagaceae bacterium]